MLDSQRQGNQIVLIPPTRAPRAPRPESLLLRKLAYQRGLAPDQIAVIDVANTTLPDLMSRGQAGLVEWMTRRGGLLLFANIDRAHPEVIRALRNLDSQCEWHIPAGGGSTQVIWAHQNFHPIFSGSVPTGPFRSYFPNSAF